AEELQATATLFAKQPGVLCGVEVAAAVFRRVDPTLEVEQALRDGDVMERGSVALRARGSAAMLLTAERTAVNFMQHLSGVATLTAVYVEAVKDTGATIIDTRKTLPGLRALEKHAVRCGGGHNHRQNLGDGILIKDNHIAALRGHGMSLGDIVRQAHRRASHTIKVEVEVTTLEEAEEALDAGAQLLLLDNMPPELMKQAVELNRGRAVLEASGGINLDTVRAVAETGVDLISVGALTHSAPALDISMDISYLG
ncbi:MAG: carboxylating nicotinate-nucleotide diphosphorylase, partial [Chloroflexota bacterium]|nr:carboxylating nicotinate-nucleotide diphosphorylase [Chloroflexota bacterium]